MFGPKKEKKVRYRGGELSKEEVLARIDQIRQIGEFGGHWDLPEDNSIGDNPEDWIVDELEYLEGLLDELL